MVQDNLKYYGFVVDGNVRLEKGDCFCHHDPHEGHHNHCHDPHHNHCHDPHGKPHKPAPFPPEFCEKPSKPDGDKHPHDHGVKEVEDVLYSDGKRVGVDNYVRGGYFDFKRGIIVFDLGEGKRSKIDMMPLSEHVLNHTFVKYSGQQYPSCNKQLSIIFENNEGIFGKCFDGGGAYSLATINRRNEIEIGSRKMPIMIQGLTERPRYNEKNEFAFLSDIPEVGDFATKKWVKEQLSSAAIGDVDLEGYLKIEEADERYAAKPIGASTIKAKALLMDNLFVE